MSGGELADIFLNLFDDFERESQGISGRFIGPAETFSALNPREEIFQLFPERLGFLDLDFFMRDLKSIFSENLRTLGLVIERDISIFLEDSDFALSLGREAGSGQVRDRTIFEFDADIRNVFKGCEHVNSNRIETLHLGLYETLHDINVVNHHVKHHAAILNARSKRTQTVDFEEADVSCDLFDAAETGIVAFNMAHLKGAIFFPGQLEEFVGFFEAQGEGFFNEGVDARAKKFPGNGSVGCRRSGNADGLRLSHEIPEIGCEGDFQGVRPFLFRSVQVADADQFRLIQRSQNPGVFLAHMPNPNHSNFNLMSHFR